MNALKSLLTVLSSSSKAGTMTVTAGSVRRPPSAGAVSPGGWTMPTIRRWLGTCLTKPSSSLSVANSMRPSSSTSVWNRFNGALNSVCETHYPLGASHPPHHQFQQQREMSKYLSKAAKKRLVLTTKRARKGFYKGKGATKEGHLTSTGKFVVDPLRRLQLVAPDLSAFKLKPYIASTVPRYPPEEQHNPMPR